MAAMHDTCSRLLTCSWHGECVDVQNRGIGVNIVFCGQVPHKFLTVLMSVHFGCTYKTHSAASTVHREAIDCEKSCPSRHIVV